MLKVLHIVPGRMHLAYAMNSSYAGRESLKAALNHAQRSMITENLHVRWHMMDYGFEMLRGHLFDLVVVDSECLRHANDRTREDFRRFKHYTLPISIWLEA